MRSFITLLSALSPGLLSQPALAAQADDCLKSNFAQVKTVNELFQEFQISPGQPCPEQDRYDTESKACKSLADSMKAIEESLRNLVKHKCRVAEQMRQLPGPDACKQKSCQDKQSALMKQAKEINDMEIEHLQELRQELKDFVKAQAVELAEGARKVQKLTVDNAASNPSGRDNVHVPKFERMRGMRYANNQAARAVFKDSLETIGGLVEKARSGQVNKSDISQVKTGLTREPLAIAAAADEWEKQMAKRQEILRSQSALYTDNKAKTDDRSEKLGNEKKPASADAKKGAQAASEAAGQGAQAGSGAAGGAGSGESGEGAGGGGGGGMPSLPTGGGGGGSGGGGGGGYAASGTGDGGDAVGSPSSAAVDSPATFIPGSTASLASKKAAGTAASRGGEGTNSIKGLEDALSKGTSTDISATTGASANRGSALRDALRARLAGDGGSSGGGGATTGASMAPGSGGGGGGTGSSASSGAVPASLLPAAGSYASDNPLDASEASLGGDLGMTDFSLAGSETDAAVKGMLDDLGFSKAHDAEGDHDSSTANAPEILSSESASLFSRTRETHLRSLRKGLLINGLRAKL